MEVSDSVVVLSINVAIVSDSVVVLCINVAIVSDSFVVLSINVAVTTATDNYITMIIILILHYIIVIIN